MTRKKYKHQEINFEPNVVPEWVHKKVYFTDLNIHQKINMRANRCFPGRFPTTSWSYLWQPLYLHDIRIYNPFVLSNEWIAHHKLNNPNRDIDYTLCGNEFSLSNQRKNELRFIKQKKKKSKLKLAI